MNVDKKTVICGYQVELEFITDGDDIVSICSVEKLGTPFGSSLGMLMGFGTLEDYETGDELDVPDAIRTKIIHWAEANGY